MDQQDSYALERSTDRDASKEHLASNDEDDFDLILLGRSEELQGSTPGKERRRVALPQHQPFHRIKEGLLDATEAAGAPEWARAHALYWPKRAWSAIPIATTRD